MKGEQRAQLWLGRQVGTSAPPQKNEAGERPAVVCTLLIAPCPSAALLQHAAAVPAWSTAGTRGGSGCAGGCGGLSRLHVRR